MGAALADVEPLHIAIDQLPDGKVQIADTAARRAALAGDSAIAREDFMQRVYQATHIAAHVTSRPGILQTIVLVERRLAHDRRAVRALGALGAPWWRGGRANYRWQRGANGWSGALGPLCSRPLSWRVEPLEAATASWSGARGTVRGARLNCRFLSEWLLYLHQRGLGRMAAAMPVMPLVGIHRAMW